MFKDCYDWPLEVIFLTDSKMILPGKDWKCNLNFCQTHICKTSADLLTFCLLNIIPLTFSLVSGCHQTSYITPIDSSIHSSGVSYSRDAWSFDYLSFCLSQIDSSKWYKDGKEFYRLHCHHSQSSRRPGSILTLT